jgi:hypothetical protein
MPPHGPAGKPSSGASWKYLPGFSSSAGAVLRRRSLWAPTGDSGLSMRGTTSSALVWSTAAVAVRQPLLHERDRERETHARGHCRAHAQLAHVICGTTSWTCVLAHACYPAGTLPPAVHDCRCGLDAVVTLACRRAASTRRRRATPRGSGRGPGRVGTRGRR